MSQKPILFFKHEDSVGIFDPLEQRYFSIEKTHGDHILWGKEIPADITNEIQESNVLEKPSDYFKNITNCWQGEPISLWTHLSTRITLDNSPILDETDFVEEFTAMSDGAEVPPPFLPAHQGILELPDPTMDFLDNITLKDAFLKRKTSRQFKREPVSLEALSCLLFSCFGPIHGTSWADFDDLGVESLGARRSFPSATGLHGTEIFVMIRSFSGLNPGIYFYDPKEHCLLKVNAEPSDNDVKLFLGDQFWGKDIAIGFFLVSNMERVWAKDIKNRGYVVSYLETGHASQNIQLAAKAFNLDTWITGSLRDDLLVDLLKLDGTPHFVSCFVGIGSGFNHSIPKGFF